MPNLVDIGGRESQLSPLNAAMSANPPLWRRVWRALSGAIKRAILGKSGHDYMKQYTGTDEYWDSAIAAQRGWPRQKLQRSHAETGRHRA